MSEELLDLILKYIDAKTEDAIFNHKVSDHSGCYYAYSNDASKVREEIKAFFPDKSSM